MQLLGRRAVLRVLEKGGKLVLVSDCLDSAVRSLAAAPPGDSGPKRWPCRSEGGPGPKVFGCRRSLIYRHNIFPGHLSSSGTNDPRKERAHTKRSPPFLQKFTVVSRRHERYNSVFPSSTKMQQKMQKMQKPVM